MTKEQMMTFLLDSWHTQIVFVDTHHVIQYMNAKAMKQYGKWGDLIGKSIFSCHNENSCKRIKEIFSRLENGEEEVVYDMNHEKHRVYMRAIRDENGALVGYFERFEPPIGK